MKEKIANLQSMEKVNHFSKHLFDSDSLALAMMASFNEDPRLVLSVIENHKEKKEWEKLKDILRIVRLYGRFDAVLKIQEIGITNNIDFLKVEDFEMWFFSHGIFWFDLSVDYENNLIFMSETHCSLMSSLISKNKINQKDISVLCSRFPNSKFKHKRQKLLVKLFKGEDPICLFYSKFDRNLDIDLKFKEYCVKHNIIIFKKLQTGIDYGRRCSNVYLIQDADGIFKVCKELLDYNSSPLGNIFDNEDNIYKYLKPETWFPKYCCRFEVDNGIYFIKLSFKYGQVLADYINPHNLLSKNSVLEVVADIAEKIQTLHDQGVVYLDVRPANFLLNDDGVVLLDFGLSRILKFDQEEVDIFLTDPKYGTPECASRLKGSKASDVFQLGILFHQLLTGSHPFALDPILVEEKSKRSAEILSHFWSNAVVGYSADLAKLFDDDRLKIIERMLSKSTEDRPTMKEVFTTLREDGKKQKIILFGKSRQVKKEKNTVLFVARMGVPHKGHIEFISRLIDLGFYVKISLQRSYTITERDPLPKWIVMKMVANSLFDKGFSKDHFEFIFTPYYRTQQEMRMHFLMMSGFADVIGVASSNPNVSDLFTTLKIFDQKSVFGNENEEYVDLSWGAMLRRAIVEGDLETVEHYSASGNAKILELSEYKDVYATPLVEFVTGKVLVKLVDFEFKTIVSGRVIRYLSPEENIARYLRQQNKTVEIISPYEKKTIVLVAGVKKIFEYVKTTFEKGGEVIYYKCT